MRLLCHAILYSIALFALVTMSSSHAGLYRWVDANGKVHYSDTVPPEQAGKGGDVINTHGITVKQMAEARTDNKKSQAEQRALLKKKQEEMRRQASDKSLLSAYRHEGDILEARDENIAIVNAAELVIQGNIHRTRLHLLHIASLTDKQVSDLKRLLHSNYMTLFRYEGEKEKIERKYMDILTRYRHIREFGPGNNEPMPAGDDENMLCMDHHLKCPDAKTCENWWLRTRQYLLKHSDMPILIESDILLSTKMPLKNEEVSISAALNKRGADGNGEILLDLDCGHTDANGNGSEETTTHEGECISLRSKQIRKIFRPFVTQAP